MTENLVSAISRFLTPEMIGKMASVSGLDRSTTQSAVGACVPAILNGLADLAAKPGGARQIADAIAEQPAGMLSSLAQTIGSASMPAEKGTGLLSSLFGGGLLNTLVSTLSRFVGIGEGSTRTLLGLLAPVILGVLGREQRAAGLETGGLARMLMGQKDQIAAAMPVGLSDLLSSRVRMHEGGETVREGRTYDAPETAQTYRATTSTPGTRRPVEARETESSWSWAYWALPLLALGGLLWYLLPGSQTGTDRTATAPPTQVTPGTPGTQTTTPATPGKVTYLTKPAADWTPVGMYYQQDIHNKAGEKIGTIKDLLISADGRVQAAVLSVGRFLGLGEKDVAVPMSVLEIDRRSDGSRVTIDVVKETLQSAPAFEGGTDRIRLKQ